jgi:hypothetical protein
MWQLVDAKARLLTNALWQEADVPYTFRLRPEISRYDAAEAFEARDQIGEWTPGA